MPLDICKCVMVCACEGECVCVREKERERGKEEGGTCVLFYSEFIYLDATTTMVLRFPEKERYFNFL